MEKITSRKNPLIRHMRELKDSAQKRRETGEFLCEGARLCRDAALYGTEILVCLYTARAGERYGEYLAPILKAAGEVKIIDEPVAELLSDTRQNQGVFCLCKRQEVLLSFGNMPYRGQCVVLENIQDPGNLGGILRTAEALGIGQVVLLGSSPDPLSPKVLRASMGAVLRSPIFFAGDARELAGSLKRHGYLLLSAVADRDAESVLNLDLSSGINAVFIGNEGAGLTDGTKGLCDRQITVPMPGRAESLNASAAATILMWELSRKGDAYGQKSILDLA